jgi:hypothetical protein
MEAPDGMPCGKGRTPGLETLARVSIEPEGNESHGVVPPKAG